MHFYSLVNTYIIYGVQQNELMKCNYLTAYVITNKNYCSNEYIYVYKYIIFTQNIGKLKKKKLKILTRTKVVTYTYTYIYISLV